MKFTTAITFIVLAIVATTGIEGLTVRGSTTHINRLTNPTLAQGERHLMKPNSMKSPPQEVPSPSPKAETGC